MRMGLRAWALEEEKDKAMSESDTELAAWKSTLHSLLGSQQLSHVVVEIERRQALAERQAGELAVYKTKFGGVESNISWFAEAKKAYAELADLRQRCEKLEEAASQIYCTYCGQVRPRDPDWEVEKQNMVNHMETCDQRPEMKLADRIVMLKAQVANLQVANQKLLNLALQPQADLGENAKWK